MNWGTKLMIGMISFMLFIISLVVIMFMRNEKDSLIEKDYYEKGQSYDTEYQAKEKVFQDEANPEISVNHTGITITFPKDSSYDILCRRASDSKMDKSFSSDSAGVNVFIPSGHLHSGPWMIKISYRIGTEEYLYESKIVLP